MEKVKSNIDIEELIIKKDDWDNGVKNGYDAFYSEIVKEKKAYEKEKKGK